MHSAGCEARWDYQEDRVAHVPAHVHHAAPCEWRRRQSGARTTAPRVSEDHDGRLCAGGDACQAQGTGESSGDAAGHRDEEKLKIIVSPLKIGLSDKSFIWLASPTGFEPVLPP